MAEYLWLTEEEVASLVSLERAINLLEDALRSLARGSAYNIPKALRNNGDGSSLYSLGSVFSDGCAGFKNWVNTPRGATAIYVLFNTQTGGVEAVLEAFALGQLRTAAIAGLATRWLAHETAAQAALIGTGSQAMAQLAAVAAVRRIESVFVYSPNPAHVESFVAQAREAFPFRVRAASSLTEATAAADVVTLVTRAKEPVLRSEAVKPGVHINAMGALLPTHAELHPGIFERANPIVVDDLENAGRLSREFKEGLGEDSTAWSRVELLSNRILAEKRRSPTSDVSVFKSLGMGISDLAIAAFAVEQARQRGAGEQLPAPKRTPIQWQRRQS